MGLRCGGRRGELIIKPIYLHDWDDTGWEGRTGLEALKNDFKITDEDLQGVQILLASYTYRDYEGDAFVLFAKDGKLFEVNGSHCSCYGLEGQWDPEEANIEELFHRLDAGYFGVCEPFWWSDEKQNVFAVELRQLLEGLKNGEISL